MLLPAQAQSTAAAPPAPQKVVGVLRRRGQAQLPVGWGAAQDLAPPTFAQVQLEPGAQRGGSSLGDRVRLCCAELALLRGGLEVSQGSLQQHVRVCMQQSAHSLCRLRVSRTKPINTELLALPVCFNQEPKPHCPSLRFSSPRPLTAPRAWWHLNHFHLASTTGPPWPQQQGTWAQHGHNMGTTTTATTDCPDTAATADHLDVMPMATGSPCTPGCCGAVVSTHHHTPYHYHHSHHSGPGHVPAILGTLQQGPSAKVQTSHAPNPS